MKTFRDFDKTESIVMNLIVNGNYELFTLKGINSITGLLVLNEDGTKVCDPIRGSRFEATVEILIWTGCDFARQRFVRAGGTLFHSVFAAVKAAINHIESIEEEE